MNNAHIHKSEEVAFWAEERGLKILFMPLHSPFLDPIEKFWPKLKHVLKEKKLDECNVIRSLY